MSSKLAQICRNNGLSGDLRTNKTPSEHRIPCILSHYFCHVWWGWGYQWRGGGVRCYLFVSLFVNLLLVDLLVCLTGRSVGTHTRGTWWYQTQEIARAIEITVQTNQVNNFAFSMIRDNLDLVWFCTKAWAEVGSKFWVQYSIIMPYNIALP